MLTACGTSEKKTVEGENPFFAEYTTPFGVPPFDQIKFEHYKPAVFCATSFFSSLASWL